MVKRHFRANIDDSYATIKSQRRPCLKTLTLSRCALICAAVVAPAIARGDEPAASPRSNDNRYFAIDPVADGVLIGAGVGFSFVLYRILGTGEIRPTLPGDPDLLLGIDRVAVTQTIDPHANRNSNLGVWTAYGYALFDSILSGVRVGRETFLVDAIIYGESIALTQVVTDFTKIAVRRPRPIDYRNCRDPTTGGCTTDTNLQLSFFSGHASATASISATATYLAFLRAPHSSRPWITLGVGTALTAFVSYERVRAGQHFPTDVIMGSLAGAAIGVLVPHFHRRRFVHENEAGATPTWIGFLPDSRGYGSVAAQWIF